jgi:hypothetical protein
MELGCVQDAVDVLKRAGALAERPPFAELDRAEVLFGLGSCRLKLSRSRRRCLVAHTCARALQSLRRPRDQLRARLLEAR